MVNCSFNKRVDVATINGLKATKADRGQGNNMLKKSLLAGIGALAVSLGGGAYAAGLLDVTVVSVNENVATVQARGTLPDWVQNGTQVQAAGWGSSISAVSDDTFELHFQEGRTHVVKPDTQLLIRAEQGGSDGLACG